jgi:predicted site-specific integrase-resolvase
MSRIDLVSVDEAADILGCSASTVRHYLHDGRLTAHTERYSCLDRQSVEHLAAHVYGWLTHRNDPHPYWVSGQRAAATLGVDRATLERLNQEHRLSCIRHRDGTTLYRRLDLIAVHRARDARAWSGS